MFEIGGEWPHPCNLAKAAYHFHGVSAAGNIFFNDHDPQIVTGSGTEEAVNATDVLLAAGDDNLETKIA